MNPSSAVDRSPSSAAGPGAGETRELAATALGRFQAGAGGGGRWDEGGGQCRIPGGFGRARTQVGDPRPYTLDPRLKSSKGQGTGLGTNDVTKHGALVL